MRHQFAERRCSGVFGAGSLFALLLFAVLLAGAWTVAEPAITIGVPLPLTGEAANEGTDLKKLFVFANNKLGGGRYRLQFEDDRCSEREAVSIAQKFVNVDRLSYVLGFACSGTVLAAAPIYEKGKVLSIAVATGAPGISTAGDYIFRTMPNLTGAADILSGHVATRGKRFGLLVEETGYGQEMLAAFRAAAPAVDLKLHVETYLPGTTDFRSVFVRFRAQRLDGLILIPQAEPGLITLYQQIRGAQWQIPVYTIFYAGFPAFLAAFGPAADGIVFADLPFVERSLGEGAARLFAEYQETNGPLESSPFYFITALSAFHALHQALQSGSDPKAYLYNHRFSGLFGDYGFDKNGDVDGSAFKFVLKILRKGAPIPFAQDREQRIDRW